MNRSPNSSPEDAGNVDPLLRSARREALIAGLVWLAALLWTVGYCTRYGYGILHETRAYVWGIPRWVFFGVIAPWFASTAFNAWFSHWLMQDFEFENVVVDRLDVDPLEATDPAEAHNE